MISVASLVAAGVQPTQARAFADPLRAACALFAIDTPRRIGAFLGQALVESTGLTRLEENCYWTTPERIHRFFPSRVPSVAAAIPLARNPARLASVVYANKNGNGDAASGDGWAYRGRGLFQLTGRGNYERAAAQLLRPYVEAPELVALPSDACLTAAWYWSSIGGNRLADDWKIAALTRAVNGPASDQAARRIDLSNEAAQAFA